MEDERLKSDSGSLHVEIKDDKVILRIEAMNLALEGAGSGLVNEYLIHRASLIYNFLETGFVPKIPEDGTEPVMHIN